MQDNVFPLLAALLVTATAFLILVSRDWRLTIGLLAAQYVGLFVLLEVSWPTMMAITRLVAGWISGAVLGMAIISLPAQDRLQNPEDPTPLETSARLPATGALFGLLSALLMLLLAGSLYEPLRQWQSNLSPEQAWASLVLIGLALLQMGLHDQALPITVGLLTLISGFEILLVNLATTPLAAGLLALVTLGTALAGAYLTLSPHMQEAE